MPLYAIAAALVATLCWGGNFSATKWMLHDLPPFLLLAVRFAIVAAFLALFALRARPWPPLRGMAFLSVSLIVAQFGFLFTAMRLDLSITSTVIATQMGVPFACLLTAILYKDYLGPWRSAGLMVALLGVVIVAGTPNASEHWGAFLVAMMGAFAWAIANIYMKRAETVSVVSLLFWPALFSVPQFMLLSALTEQDHWQHLMHARPSSWVAMGYSVFFSSMLGYGLWNWLIKRFPLSQVVPYSLFVPIAGLGAGVVIFHDALTVQMLLGAALTIIGVAIISLRRPKLVEAEGM